MDAHADELDFLRGRVAELEELLGLRSALPLSLGLCRMEQRVLGVLISCSPRVASREFIANAVWERVDMMPSFVAINQHICRVRAHGVRIESVRGIGYVISKEECERLERDYG